MSPKDLPDRWKSRLNDWIREKRSEGPPHLGASEFPGRASLRLEFADGSSALFHYAFAIKAPELGEIGVFTEHCGYHVFPLIDTHVAQTEDMGS